MRFEPADLHPRNIWWREQQFRSGVRIAVTGAAFLIDGSARGGVTVTMAVPDDLSRSLEGGGVSATVLLDPTEAQTLCEWLRAAADSIANVGPGLYDLG